MKNFLLVIITFCVFIFGFTQTNISGVINNYAAVTNIDISACRTSFTVDDASLFNVGDSILIIQMQGASINTSNSASFGDITALGSAGNYEKNVISAVNGNVISLGLQLVNPYDATGSVQIVSIPHYTGDVNVNGVLTAAEWNGSTGGVLIFSATGDVTLSANINVRQRGFRGGANVIVASYTCNFISNIDGYSYPLNTQFAAGKGEGIAKFIAGQETGRGKQANGGGGGNDHNAGGAGAGNGSSGGNGGTNSEPGFFNCKGNFPGIGGLALPYTTNKLFMGGGGGCGQGNNAAYTAPDGAGIVIIKANSILGGSWNIFANGNNGGNVSNDGGIGASAGGAVLLEVQSWAASLNVNVSGGNGGNTLNIGDRCYGPGGGGGAGVLVHNQAAFGNNLLATSGTSGLVTTSTNLCNGTTLGATAGGGPGLSIANRELPLSNTPLVIDSTFVTSLGIDTIALCVGQDYTFNLGASVGDDIQWQIDSTGAWEDLIPNANHNNVNQNNGFTLVNVQSYMDLFSYRMRVANACDTSFSDRIYLHVNDLPIISVQPAPVNACVGSNIFFTAEVSNTDTYQWQFNDGSGFQALVNGANYQGVDSDTLRILNASLAQNGYSFQVVLSNSCGNSVTSTPATLNVDVAPSISVTGPINACEGNGVFITPTPPSGSNITYQWQVDSTGGVWEDLNNTGGYTNTDAFVLGISSGTVSLDLDGNFYRVIINTNCGNDTSNAVVLNVTPRVVYTVQPTNDTVCLGETAVISATALNASAYQWQSNAGGPYANLSNNAIFSGVNTNTLTIANVGLAQTGVFYRLRTLGNSPCGNVNSGVAQIFIAPQSNAITSTSSSFTYCPGLDTVMYFSFTGIVDSIVWQVDSGSGMVDLLNNSYHSNVSNDSLVLTGMDASLNGNNYQAIIYNDCGGSDTSAIIQVNIRQQPTFSFGTNQAVCLGDEAVFTQTTSVPVIGKQWQIWNGTTYINLSNSAPYSGVNSDTLRISPVNLTMDGDSFRVEIIDSCGTVTQNLIPMVLNVAAPAVNNEVLTLCSGGSLILSDGTVVTSSGNFNDTLTGGASNGCDSIVNYDLTVLPLNATSETTILCFGDSLLRADGSFESTSGVYIDTLFASDSNGCDSIHTINLTVAPLASTNRNITLCLGDSLALNDGSFVNTSGVYNDTITSGAANGCDSIDIINLVILPFVTATRNETICFGDSFTLFDGSFVSTSGTYNDTIFAGSVEGCDSIDVINLTIAPLITDTVNNTICSNDSLVLSNGTVINTAGTYNDTLIATNGCDSLLVYNLSVNPETSFTTTQSICNGEQFVLPGGSLASTSGIYLDTLVGANIFGCDSIIETTLIVLPAADTLLVDSFCSGGSYTLASGAVVNAAGIYNDTLLAAASTGCDSILVYNLSLNATPPPVQVVDTICFNDSYVLPDGILVTATGIYLDTIPASNSCDSIVETNLFVRPANAILAQSNNLNLCPGEDALFYANSALQEVSYQWFNGGVLMPGETNDTLIISNVSSANTGASYQLQIYALCDTLFANTVTLNVREEGSIVTSPTDFLVCEDELVSFTVSSNIPVQSYQWYVNGSVIAGANSDTYSINSTTIADDGNQYFCAITDSCGNLDSSDIATLTVNPDLSIDAVSNSVDACTSDDVLFFVQASGVSITYQWLENGLVLPGETNDTLLLANVTSAQDGNIYTCQVNSDCGNELSQEMTLTVNEVAQILNQSGDIEQCGGFSFEVNVEATGIATYQWQINQGAGFVNLSDGTFNGGPFEVNGSNTGTLLISNFDSSISGTQFQVVLSAFCGTDPIFSPITVNISEPEIITDRVADTTICLDQIAPINVPYVDAAAEWSNGDLGQFFLPEFTGDYIVRFTDANNCPQSDTLFVRLEDCLAKCVVVAPTGFSPNANGTNDIFRAIYMCELDFYELEIYNRWGELVFKSDDPLIGWDGTYQGQNAQIGTYTWYVEYKKLGLERKEEIKGNVTLIR